MTKPVLGIPYHPKYANDAFYLTVRNFKHYFAVKLLDCQKFNTDSILQIDGLLLPGAHYDYDFKLFGSTNRDNRCDYLFKKSMHNEAIKRGMPVLGLCAGTVLMNHTLGGSIGLISKSEVNHDLDPQQGDLAHSITIPPGTHLHDICRDKNESKKALNMQVNSWHHGGVKKIAKDLTSSAVAPDGVVEAIEMRHPGNPNYWGLQFHPEYVKPEKTPEEYQRQSRILRAFQQACLQFHYKRKVNQKINKQNSSNEEREPVLRAHL